MQAHNSSIEEFMSAHRTVFVVPVYQRNYDWLDGNCDQLFQDILRVIESGKEHFLGTICFKAYSSHEKSIIDGQQRLTSITLLLKALHDLVEEKSLKEEIQNCYFYNRGHCIDTDYFKTKLHLNKRDDAIYHILLENTYSTAVDKLTARQKDSRIYRNYLRFYEHLEKYIKEGKDVNLVLESLRNLTIIELEVQNENPQEIFESLNSTGLDLTNVDLLRNYFLMQFNHEQQTTLYNDFWFQIENIVGVDNMEQFFVDYLVFKKRSDAININMRRSHINEKTLYTAFKLHYSNYAFGDNYANMEACFQDLKDCAEIYKNFLFKPDVVIAKESKLRQKLYFLLTVNETSKSRSLLLYVFDRFDKGLISTEILDQVVDIISSLTFRARICKAQGINRQFSGSVMQRLEEHCSKEGFSYEDDFLNAFWQAITSGKGSYAFPPDDEFRDALVHKDMYSTLKSRGTKYLLYILEMHSPMPKGLPLFDDETITIEHVMPQTLDDAWRNYLDESDIQEFETNLHRLGNLSLTNYNPELSNKQFCEKKDIYKMSNFYYSKKLCDFQEWKSADIHKRSELLADEAMKVWSFPAKYQKKNIDKNQLHKFDEDAAQFTFSKPSLLLIDDQEFSVEKWNDFIPTVCKKLVEDNRDAFEKAVTPEKLKAVYRNDSDENYAEKTGYEQIATALYVRTAKSAYETIKVASRIVQLFDAEAGTDYSENIRFALKK